MGVENQMVTIAKSGMVNLQQRVNQADKLKEVGNGIYFWWIFGGVRGWGGVARRTKLLRKCKK